MLDEFAANRPVGGLREQLGIDPDAQVVGIFPGSRNSELKYIFSTLLETAQQLLKSKPDVKFLLPVAPSLPKELFQEKLSEYDLPIKLIEENIYEVASACDAILSVSGTVTLQIALVGTPMAIVYKVAPLSYAVGRRLIRIPFAGLPNIVLGKEIVREFIQEAATSEALGKELVQLLDDQAYTAKMRQNLAEVRQQMGTAGCSARVVRMIENLLADGK